MQQGNSVWINSIAVSKTYSKCGAGTRLVYWILGYAKLLFINSVKCDTLEENKAYKFWERMKFENIEK